MADNYRKLIRRRCGTYCQYFERLGFLCTYEIQISVNKERGQLKRKLPIINLKSKNLRDSESLAEEKFYRAVLEEVLGDDKASTLLARISAEHQTTRDNQRSEKSPLNTFFQTLRNKPNLLRKYVNKETAREIITFIKFQDKSKIPMYIKLGGSCPYSRPPTTLKKYLSGIQRT